MKIEIQDREHEFTCLVMREVAGNSETATWLRSLPGFKEAKLQHRKYASDRIVRGLLQRAIADAAATTATRAVDR